MKISFIGDIMLGRMIGSKYDVQPYEIVANDVKESVAKSDFVIANLESPIAINAKTDGDHLQFSGNSKLVEQFKWITAFSLANNHITDCGILGIDETIEVLNSNGIQYNGVFETEYIPLEFEKDGIKISIITFTDMLNIPFENGAKWNVLRMGDKKITNLIAEEKKRGKIVILFAHVGMLFTRYPNPVTYNYLHKCVDSGADIIITCHSHCLGGMETYKGVPIFHSLGDFCMDGNSFRRRTASILNLNIDNNGIGWDIIPTFVQDDLTVTLLNGRQKEHALKSFNEVRSNILSHTHDYEQFFKKQYNKEIVLHSLSTLKFLIHERGVVGLLKMLRQRSSEVFRTIKWSISDRSKEQRDDDAIKSDRKKISQKELFGK